MKKVKRQGTKKAKIPSLQNWYRNIYTDRSTYGAYIRIPRIKTVKEIAAFAGLEIYSLYFDNDYECLKINFQAVDPYGEAKGEVQSLYKYCLRMRRDDEKNPLTEEEIERRIEEAELCFKEGSFEGREQYNKALQALLK